jgi:hypothetical protein
MPMLRTCSAWFCCCAASISSSVRNSSFIAIEYNFCWTVWMMHLCKVLFWWCHQNFPAIFIILAIGRVASTSSSGYKFHYYDTTP